MWKFGIRFLASIIILFGLQTTVLANEEIIEEYLIIEGNQTKIIDFMNENDMPINKVYSSFLIISTELTKNEIELLKSEFPTINIQENQVYEQSKDTDLPSSKLVNASSNITSPYTGAGVKVAVLDSGIDINHRDLKVKGGYCSLEIQCAFGIPYNDDHGHGTHVAGIIAALNNGVGITGISPNVDLYSIKALDALGFGSTNSLIEGIEWAIKNNIDILNMSVTTKVSDVALERALKSAYDKGILIVGSSGNNGNKLDKTIQYPAKYDTVVAVGAVNPNLTKLPESAIGPELDVVAPGGNIYSTYPIEWDFMDGKADGYTTMSGTSMATPHVTGILALYKERFPTKTNVELRKLINDTAKDLGPAGKDPNFGYGLVQYVPKFSESVVFTMKTEIGKALLTTKTANVKIQSNGKQLTPLNEQWTIYGVGGQKEILVTSTDANGKSLVEKQFINLSGPTYKDVSNRQPSAGPIGFMSHHGQIKGFDDGTFRPYTNITRGEAAVLIGRALDFSGAPAKTKFSDVPTSSFASGYINEAVEQKIISGFTDGTFRPGAYVTRAEMAILISKAYDLKAGQGKYFTDVKSTMAAYESIRALTGSGITTGYSDGRFQPYNKMTRADFAVFLARVQNDEFK